MGQHRLSSFLFVTALSLTRLLVLTPLGHRGTRKRLGRSWANPRAFDTHEFEAPETMLNRLERGLFPLMPESFDSPRDHDTDMASDDDQPEMGQRLDALSIYQNTDSGHGVSDSDDDKSMNDDERVCQGRLDQMDTCFPVTSTSRTAVRGPNSQLQQERGVRIRKIRRIPQRSISRGCRFPHSRTPGEIGGP